MKYRCSYCVICVLLISSLAMTIFIGSQAMRLPSKDRWFSYYWFHAGVTLFFFCITSLAHLVLWHCDLYQISPIFLLISGAFTSVSFIIGDLDRRFNKSSDDSEYYIVLCTGLLTGFFVGLFLKTVYSFSSRRWHIILPFLSAAIAASAFYLGREAYEDTDYYDYKGSMIPLAITMGALIVISISVYIDDRVHQYSILDN
jgi:hypothetical protein